MRPTEEQAAYNEYLLEHFRHSGLFKCTECIYGKREESQHGEGWKCVHEGVLLNSYAKDRDAVMLGCACSWFEPRADAGRAAGARKVKTEEVLRRLWDYAWRHTDATMIGDSQDERQLRRMADELWEIGVRL